MGLNFSDEDFVESLKKYSKIEGDQIVVDSGLSKMVIGRMSLTKKEKIKAEYLNWVGGREKNWVEASELLTDYILSELNLYTTKEDKQNEVWVYKEGIYIPEGRSEIKEILRDVLGKHFSSYIYGLVLAKIEPDTYINPDDFFNVKHIYEIPVENGILNIQTLELTEFTPKKIFFNKIPVTFDITKECPNINKFLKEVLADEEDLKVFYELVGFGLLSDYRFEKAFMLVGDGRNGKGKSLELIKRLFGGKNCVSLPLTMLKEDSFSVSDLFQKRFNLAGDISGADLKSTSMFKSLTGRDLICGKRKFLSNIYFENYAKLVFACNELPMVYDLSRGFWERWVLLEYPYTFVTQEEYDKSKDKSNLKIKDTTIIDKITTPEELSGFLNQAILGLHRLFENKNFSITKGTEEVKNTWIRKSNSFMAFCLDNIEEDFEGKILKKELRKRYNNFCKQHKVIAKSDVIIKRVMIDNYGAFEDQSRMGEWNGERFWEGVKWKE